LAFRFLAPNHEDQLQFTPDMKKIFALTMLVSFAMICSCQKQDSAAQQQLAQRKVELDAREEALADRKSALDERQKALDERQKALDEREKSLAEKQKGTMNARPNPTDVQGQTPDPAQLQAERDRIIQQLSAMSPPDTSQLEKAGIKREIRAQTQPGLEELKEKKRKLGAMGTSPAPQ
jgi:hypothetical protein